MESAATARDLGLSDLRGLAGLMAGWRGRSAYILDFVGPRAVPLGNNGDTLLRRVCLRVLADLDIRITSRLEEADVLVVPPGGALLDRYRAPSLLRMRLARVPDIPLVLLPASSWFERDDPAEMLVGRTAPTLWISREPRSYAHLRTAWGRSLSRANVTLALDHDMVVSGHRHVPGEIGAPDPTAAPGGALVVARLGAEAGSMQGFSPPPSAPHQLAVRALQRSPALLQHRVRRRTTRDRQATATARILARVAAAPGGGDVACTPPGGIDISDPTLMSYAGYSRAIRRANVVVTDRLHVALPAAILGTPTWLVDAGYHKLAGVYEHSLAHLPHVRFLGRASE